MGDMGIICMRRWRRRSIALLALPLALLAADTIYWWVAEQRLGENFAAWVALRRSDGWTITSDAPQRGGWPAAAVLTLPGVSLSGGNAIVPGGLAWRADRLSLEVALARPTILRVSASGEQSLRLGENPAVSYSAGNMLATLPLPPGDQPPASIDFAAAELVIGTPGRDAPDADTRVKSLQAHVDIRPSALAISLAADTLTPPAAVGAVLGPTITSLTVDGALDGPLVPGRTPADSAKAWRDGGGQTTIQRLALRWGPLDLTANGTLALDERLQPKGDGDAKVVGYAETIDACAAHGVISRSAATAAKAVLSLLAHTPEDGGPSDVDVPLSVRHGMLSMRDVPLIRLPELHW
jgi:hypothetical protein